MREAPLSDTGALRMPGALRFTCLTCSVIIGVIRFKRTAKPLFAARAYLARSSPEPLQWSGRRGSNPYFQLGKLPVRALFTTTYKIAKQNAPCIPCSPCQSSRSCILWWDIGGTKPSHVDLSVNNLTTAPAQVKMLEMDWFVHARSKFLSMDFR